MCVGKYDNAPFIKLENTYHLISHLKEHIHIDTSQILAKQHSAVNRHPARRLQSSVLKQRDQ